MAAYDIHKLSKLLVNYDVFRKCKFKVFAHSRFRATHWTVHFVEILAASFAFSFNLLDAVRRPVKYQIKTDCYRAVLGYALGRK